MRNTTFSVVRNRTVAERRRLTSQLYLTGRYTQEALAIELSERWGYPCSGATVCNDLAYAKALNDVVAGRNMAEWLRIELEKLDVMEDGILSQQQTKIAVEHTDEKQELDYAAALEEAQESMNGFDLKTYDLLLKIAERRTRLLGLDAPKKIAVEGGDPNKPIRVSELSDEALEAMLLASQPKG